jgi:hypothetical protein
MSLITEERKISVQAVEFCVDAEVEYWERTVFGGSKAFYYDE